MKKGEITAFLSLIFVLLISFIVAMLESASVQLAKNQKRIDMDCAIYSVFGEYRRELMEDFGLFAIEGSYETGQFSEESLLERLDYYGALGTKTEVVGIQLLSDNQGLAFREQATAYMEERTGIGIVEELAGMSGVWKEQEIQGNQYQEEGEGTGRALEQSLSEAETALPAEENPLQHLEEQKGQGLLGLVSPKGMELSEKAVELDDQPSHRSLRAGRGSFLSREMDGAGGRLLFGEYVLDKFQNAVSHDAESALSYELEYLLGGRKSDVDNLEAVVKRLLLMRTGANYVYLCGDVKKQAEAEALALTLSTLAAFPAATELVKQALLAAWAYGESILDIRALLEGKKVALIKTEESWQMQLTGLLKLGTSEDTMTGTDTEGGLAYKDYLRILLFLEDQDTVSMRSLDLIEQRMKIGKSLSFFRVDSCVTKLNLHCKASLRKGLTYEFPVYFGYQ